MQTAKVNFSLAPTVDPYGKVSRRSDPQGLSHSQRGYEWPAAGVSGQRRDDAEAARRHRPVAALLHPGERQYSSRGVCAEPKRPPRPTSKRGIVQKFIHAAKREEIIFVRGTTEAINLVAQSYGRRRLKAGDEILITAMEHHSNIVPWQMVCEETGRPGRNYSDEPRRRDRGRRI